MTLRVDNRIEFIRVAWWPRRYGVRAGKRVYPVRWKEKQCRVLWVMHSSFYWEDEGLSWEDVKALILQRERRSQQKLHTARSLMRADEVGRPTRIPIPSELRRAVFERDGGRCVECDANFDLQYDHVLPVARGGATTLENLQLLCAGCNRRKSDSL